MVYVEQEDLGSNEWDLILADAKGKKIRTLSLFDPKEKRGIGIFNIDWSPDGTKLTLLCGQTGGNPRGVYAFLTTYDIARQKTTAIADFSVESNDSLSFSEFFRWLPDSRRLYFIGVTGSFSWILKRETRKFSRKVVRSRV